LGLPDPVHDFEVRAESYHRFMLGVKWVALDLGAMIAALTVAFCTTAGLGAGIVLGAIVFAIGAWAIHSFLGHSTEQEMGYPPHR
jgi:ABC-type polysaccharide/polyol phosphate export permease